MSGYVLTPRARADLKAIWTYTADRWNSEQADRYVGLLMARCASLRPTLPMAAVRQYPQRLFQIFIQLRASNCSAEMEEACSLPSRHPRRLHREAKS